MEKDKILKIIKALSLLLVFLSLCGCRTKEEKPSIIAHIDEQVIEYHDAKELFAYKPSKKGYTFEGWGLPDETGNYQATTEEAVSKMKKTNVYAMWKVVEYSVTFIIDEEEIAAEKYTIEDTEVNEPSLPERNGYQASWETYTLDCNNIKVNAMYTPIKYNINYHTIDQNLNDNPKTYTIEESFTLKDPVAFGYDFIGWYDDLGREVEKIELGSTGNINLTAKFEIINYDINYENCEGINLGDAPIKYNVESEDYTLPEIEKFGYEFMGWYNGTKRIDKITNKLNGNLILTAKWTPITYIVTYDNLQGSANVNPINYTIESDFITLNDLSRTGYLFEGWYNGETKVEKIAGGTAGNITLTAKWSPAVYTISYHNTKGQENLNPTTYTIESGNIILSNLSKTGYVFEGWYIDETKVESVPSGSTGNIIITGKWSLKTYNITYHNIDGSTNPNPESYTVEDGYGGKISLKKPTKEWYDFVNWYSDPNFKTNFYEIDLKQPTDVNVYAKWNTHSFSIIYWADGFDNSIAHEYFNINDLYWVEPDVPEKEGYTGKWSEYTVGPSDIEVYAQYTPIDYSISYENLKNNETENPTTYNVETKTITLTPLTAVGYTFLGWYNGNTRVENIAKGTTGNLTLTAKWELANYNITYQNTKGVDTSLYLNSYTMDSETIVLPTDLAVTGYTFVGWYNDNDEKVTTIEHGSYGDIELFAKFDPINYTITYQNTKNATNQNQTTYDIETETIELLSLTTAGYAFLGWYNGDTRVENIAKGTTGNLTLTAKWELANYNITYQNTKGVDTSHYITSYTMDSETIVLPTDLVVVGYTFVGWYNNNDEEVIAIEHGSYGDIELFAKFNPINYTITYQNTKNAINQNPDNYNIDTSIRLEELESAGYTFLGWYDGETKVENIFKGTMGEITLTAKWELTIYSITYNVNGVNIDGYVSAYTIESEPIELPTDITVKGYTFNGWKNSDGNIVLVIKKGSHGNIILYADLTPTQYTIHLESMDGTLQKTEIVVSYGENYKLPIPSYENGKFLGWYNNTSDDATQMTDEFGNALNGYPYRANRTYYAHYYTTICTITFDSDGGTTVPTKTYLKGSFFNEEEVISERGTDLFEGWFTANDTRITSGTVITASMTLKAKWSESIAVSNKDEFIAIASNPTANYHLVDDINLRGDVWTPIENFSGVLDGKGYTIKNFVLSCTSPVSHFGLIKVNDGTVRNIVFEDFTYNISLFEKVDINAALFIGENRGVIENCKINSGVIKLSFVLEYSTIIISNIKFGSFVGNNKENAIVKNCYSTIGIDVTMRTKIFEHAHSDTIKHNLYLGGIVGNNYSIIENCGFEAPLDITCFAEGHYYIYTQIAENICYAGGIIGHNENNSICQNSYSNAEITLKTSYGTRGFNHASIGSIVGKNYGNIVTCHSGGSIYGGADDTSYIGGLVGYNLGAGKITSCYSVTSVTASKNSNVGGFVGTNTGIIQNSYARGIVKSTAGGNVAGFVGHNDSTGSITKCYASGNVEASNGNIGYFVASSSGTLFKCFYLRTSILILNGVQKEYITEYETVNGLPYQTLWSKDFLVNDMYWEEEGWVILTNENPILNWEIDLDDYNITIIEPDCENIGYSVYVSKTGGRFFIRNFVDAWGHSYDEDEAIVVNPTCTSKGYTEKNCLICNHIERYDYTDVLPHIKGEITEKVDATCDADGHITYECSTCHETFSSTLKATGHTTDEIIPAINPICGDGLETVDGHTAKIKCSTCEKIIQESEVIPAHNLVIVETITEPTCTVDGYGLFKCSYENCSYSLEKAIEKLDHLDENKDWRCDRCKELMGNFSNQTVIEINTIDDLMNIKNNLNGVYRLMKDLDLSSVQWTRIGSESSPFTGYFDGNGKTIINLYGTEKTVEPMFEYNRGVIANLTINYATAPTANIDKGGKSALLVMYNNGFVTGCKITGKVNINFSYITTSAEFADTMQSETAFFGALVCNNEALGEIFDCHVSAEFTVKYTHKYTLTTKLTASVLFNRMYRFNHYSNYSIYFGIITSVNNGLIANSSYTGTVNHSAGNDGAATAKTMDSNGHVYVTTNVFLYSFAAIENGTRINCNTTSNFNDSNITSERHRHFGSFWTEKENFNIIIDDQKFIIE